MIVYALFIVIMLIAIVCFINTAVASRNADKKSAMADYELERSKQIEDYYYSLVNQVKQEAEAMKKPDNKWREILIREIAEPDTNVQELKSNMIERLIKQLSFEESVIDDKRKMYCIRIKTRKYGVQK